jgi:HNH endonuclease
MSLVEPPRVLGARASTYRRVIRLDPCSYCPHRRPSGTVDHVQPKSSTYERGCTNWTGACGACNREKQTTSLLLFLLARLD